MKAVRSNLICWLLVFTSVAVARPQSTSTSLATCAIERATDHYGDDYAQLHGLTFDDCVAACQTDSNCVTVQYTVDNASCYLKNELSPATADARVDSAICRPPAVSGASTSTTTTTTTTTSVSPATTMTTATTITSVITRPSMIGTCSIVYDTDYFGGDYGNMYTPTFDACVQACEDDSQCVTVQYDKSTNICYLKNLLTQPSANTRVDTAICRPLSTSTISATTTAKATATATASSAPYPSCTIIRGTDYDGGDYDAFYATSLDICIAACQADSQCVDTQFSYTYQRCYLKNSLTTASSNPQVDTAICRGPDDITTSSTTISSSSSTTISSSTTTISSSTTTMSSQTVSTTAITPPPTPTTTTTTQAPTTTTTTSTAACTPSTVTSPNGFLTTVMLKGGSATFSDSLQVSGLCPGAKYSFTSGGLGGNLVGQYTFTITETGSGGVYNAAYTVSSTTETDNYRFTIQCTDPAGCSGRVGLNGFTATPIT